MSTQALALSNVVNVSVAAVNAGVGAYNTSNLALFTTDAPVSGWSGAAGGFSLNLSPIQPGLDFGSSSQTAAMATAVFSQSPNILAGTTPGNLVIIPLVVAIQSWAFSGTAASGTFVANFGGNATAAINWNDTASVIQGKLQALLGCAQVQVTGSIASGTLTVTLYGLYGPQSLWTFTSNSLETSGSSDITITATTATAGETISAAITRTSTLVQWFGGMATQIFGQTDLLAAAAIVQALNKIFFFVSTTTADVEPAGMMDLLRTGTLTQSRALYYGGTTAQALVYMASYAGRALSVDFSGSNTASDMHLKPLSGVQPDPSMTQTILGYCQASGADAYVSILTAPCIFASGANWFFDRVYNLQWFVGACAVAYFNYLAQNSTKTAQTEDGMTGCKGAVRKICVQGVTCQYLAPGTWTSPTTFGNQALMLQNIANDGYYLYSTPISQQSNSSRVARQAPLIQIAIQEAGSIDSGSIQINVNP